MHKSSPSTSPCAAIRCSAIPPSVSGGVGGACGGPPLEVPPHGPGRHTPHTRGLNTHRGPRTAWAGALAQRNREAPSAGWGRRDRAERGGEAMQCNEVSRKGGYGPGQERDYGSGRLLASVDKEISRQRREYLRLTSGLDPAARMSETRKTLLPPDAHQRLETQDALNLPVGRDGVRGQRSEGSGGVWGWVMGPQLLCWPSGIACEERNVQWTEMLLMMSHMIIDDSPDSGFWSLFFATRIRPDLVLDGIWYEAPCL